MRGPGAKSTRAHNRETAGLLFDSRTTKRIQTIRNTMVRVSQPWRDAVPSRSSMRRVRRGCRRAGHSAVTTPDRSSRPELTLRGRHDDEPSRLNCRRSAPRERLMMRSPQMQGLEDEER